jgi:hypothetical protein
MNEPEAVSERSSNVTTVPTHVETIEKMSSVRTASGGRNDLNFTALALSFTDAEYAKERGMGRRNSV